MKFDKIHYQILGHFSGWKRYHVLTRSDVDGYTTADLPGVAVRKRDGFWYVDHIASGAGIVVVGSSTRKAAVQEYTNNYKSKIEAMPADRLSRYIEAFRSAPSESDIETWETLHFHTLKGQLFQRVTDAAKEGGLIVRKADDATYLSGGCVDIIGTPEALNPIREMIAVETAPAPEAPAEPAPAPETTAEPEPVKGDCTMKKSYFAGLETPAEINRVYKTLSAVFHPDNGGTVEAFQELNAQRTAALAALEHSEAVPAEVLELPASTLYLPEKSETTTSLVQALKDLIDKAQQIPGVHLELCGSWLWATGNTKPVKDDLKTLGFRWSHNKAAWYWRDPSQPYHRRGKRRFSMDEIRDRHGSMEIA